MERKESLEQEEKLEDIDDFDEEAFERELFGDQEKMECELEEIKVIPEILESHGVTKGYHILADDVPIAYMYVEGNVCCLFDSTIEDRTQVWELMNSLSKYSNSNPIITFNTNLSTILDVIHYRSWKADGIRKKSRLIQWLDHGWERGEDDPQPPQE